MFELRPLASQDIDAVGCLPPKEWNFDFAAHLRRFASSSCFHAFVGTVDGAIVAVGHGIKNFETAWLGNIVVSATHRNRGYGTAMTAGLIAEMRGAGCRTQLLIATAMGEPVYAKLGFRRTGEYIFFRPGHRAPETPPQIRAARADDQAAILQLDEQATGEQRDALLGPFLSSAIVFQAERGEIRGFYLPSFAGGPIVARDPEAGRGLVAFKHGHGERTTVVPSQNAEALAFLQGAGFVEDKRAPRMCLGEETSWNQAWIWARGAGWCG